MLLRALDRAQVTSLQEQVIVLSSLTVEHVMPQSVTPDVYPYPSAESGSIPWDEQRRSLMHSLGNLTLLTQPLNSTVRNGPFSVKRSAIASQSQLLLNSYFQKFADTDSWDETTIVERGKILAGGRSSTRVMLSVGSGRYSPGGPIMTMLHEKRAVLLVFIDDQSSQA